MRTSWALASVYFVGLALAPGLGRAEGEPSVSLESLLDAGRKHHPALAKHPLISQSLELSRSKINRAYWPQLSLGGQATWQSEVTSISIPLPGVSISPPAKDQYRATLDLKQSIWDGGVAAERKQVAETQSRVEHEKANLEWYQVHDHIVELYFAGVVQQELEAQGKALQHYLGAIVDKAQVALKSGLTTERDVLLAQARQLEAGQAMAEAAAGLAGVRHSLEDLTGARLSQDVRLAAPAQSCVEPETHPAPSALRRPELSLLDAQAQVLDAQEELDRTHDYPQLGAFATGGYGRPGLNFLNTDFGFYFIGGVQLTVPLTYLYAGTRGNGREQLAVQRALVARERDAVVKQVNVQLDTTTAELRRLDAVIELDDGLLDMRSRARKQTELQLELGTASMTDLINDLTQEDQAKTRRAVHRAQRTLACHKLSLIKGNP